MKEILTKVCILYNIDFNEKYNKEILIESFKAEQYVNEEFLQSMGIYVDSLEKRIGKRFLRKKERMNRFKNYKRPCSLIGKTWRF